MSGEQLEQIVSATTLSGENIGARENQKISQFLCFTLIHFQWPTTFFLAKICPVSHFFSQLELLCNSTVKKKGREMYFS